MVMVYYALLYAYYGNLIISNAIGFFRGRERNSYSDSQAEPKKRQIEKGWTC